MRLGEPGGLGLAPGQDLASDEESCLYPVGQSDTNHGSVGMDVVDPIGTTEGLPLSRSQT